MKFQVATFMELMKSRTFFEFMVYEMIQLISTGMQEIHDLLKAFKNSFDILMFMKIKQKILTNQLLFPS